MVEYIEFLTTNGSVTLKLDAIRKIELVDGDTYIDGIRVSCSYAEILEAIRRYTRHWVWEHSTDFRVRELNRLGLANIVKNEGENAATFIIVVLSCDTELQLSNYVREQTKGWKEEGQWRGI